MLECGVTFDPQINGGNGIDFSDPRLADEQIHEVTEGWVGQGTLKYLPTVITTTGEAYAAVLPKFARAMETEWGRRHLPGLHLEGPFLTVAGAHPKDCLKPPSIDEFKRLFDLSEGGIVLMTIAPQPGAEKVIEYIVDQGVVVSIGHHDAQYVDIENAVLAGARGSTHFPNARRKTYQRDDPAFGFEMGCPDLYGMCITDKVHVTPEVARALFRCKGTDRFVIVSDASPIAKMPIGLYQVFGIECRCAYGTDGRPGLEPLTGSYWTLVDCVNIFLEWCEQWMIEVSENEAAGLWGENAFNLLEPALVRRGYSFDDFQDTEHRVSFNDGRLSVK